jgi:hypothetical protein
VDDESDKQPKLHEPHDPIVTHEMGCFIECFSTIIQKDTSVNPGMNNQKKNQKNSGKGHGEFLTERRGEKLFPGHRKLFEGMTQK